MSLGLDAAGIDCHMSHNGNLYRGHSFVTTSLHITIAAHVNVPITCTSNKTTLSQPKRKHKYKVIFV